MPPEGETHHTKGNIAMTPLTYRRTWLVLAIIAIIFPFLASCENPQARKAKHMKRGEAYLKAGKFSEAVI